MIHPDGTQSAPMGYTGGGVIDIPWGLNIDGNDDVWVGNFKGRSVVLMAGAEPRADLRTRTPAMWCTSSRAAAFRCSPTCPSIQLAMSGRPITGTFPWLRSAILRRNLDLGRRLRHHGHLRRGVPSETAAHGQGAAVLTGSACQRPISRVTGH